MPAFERRLIDAPQEEIVSTMVEAVERANYRCRVKKLNPDPKGYTKFVKETADQPEGARQWIEGVRKPDQCPPTIRATLLGIAWWTDPLQRRHTRVVGRRLEEFNEYHLNRFGPRKAMRPPLWLTYPGRVCLRTLPGSDPELIAVCGCGAVGPPEALGWMGNRCGPCHDHQEEREQPLRGEEIPYTLMEHGSTVSGLGVTQRGDAAVSVDHKGLMLFWDIKTLTVKARQELHVGSFPQRPRFDCNGKVVVAGGYEDNLITWLDASKGKLLATGTERQIPYHRVLALSQDGGLLALGSDEGLRVRRVVQPGKVTRVRGYDRFEPSALAFSQDGKLLAAGMRDGGTVLLEPQRADPRRTYDQNDLPVQSLSFSPDGTLLAIGFGEDLEDPWPPAQAEEQLRGILRLEPVDGKEAGVTLFEGGPVLTVAFTRDGKYLAAAGNDRLIRLWECPSGKPVGSLEWHLGAVQAAAFSGDGETLISASSDGLVRLWPWKALLGME